MANNSLGLGRPILFLVIIILLLVYISRSPSAAPLSPSAATRKRAPAVAQQPLLATIEEEPQSYSQRVIGLGDIHGDLPHMTAILRRMKLIDLRGRWIGGNAVIVQTGGELTAKRSRCTIECAMLTTFRAHAPSLSFGVDHLPRRPRRPRTSSHRHHSILGHASPAGREGRWRCRQSAGQPRAE